MIKVLSVVADNHFGGIQNRILSVGKELESQSILPLILVPSGDGDFSKLGEDPKMMMYRSLKC